MIERTITFCAHPVPPKLHHQGLFQGWCSTAVGHLNSVPAASRTSRMLFTAHMSHLKNPSPQPSPPAEESQLWAPAKASQKGDDFMIHNGNTSLQGVHVGCWLDRGRRIGTEMGRIGTAGSESTSGRYRSQPYGLPPPSRPS